MRQRRSRRPAPGLKHLLLDVPRFEQPDDVTCGPACLRQVYLYHGLDRPLSEILRETPRNPDGGTLAVYLGLSAMQARFRPTMYPVSLRVFDPTWHRLDAAALADKLRRRRDAMKSRNLRMAIDAHVTYLERGGRVRFRELDTNLLVRLLRHGRPILTGLSATYLYRTAREHENQYDDVRGQPAGHFVVICGYLPRTDRFVVRDPSSHIPFSLTGQYTVSADRLLAAILLGDASYDAVLLTLEPPVRLARPE